MISVTTEDQVWQAIPASDLMKPLERNSEPAPRVWCASKLLKFRFQVQEKPASSHQLKLVKHAKDLTKTPQCRSQTVTKVWCASIPDYHRTVEALETSASLHLKLMNNAKDLTLTQESFSVPVPKVCSAWRLIIIRCQKGRRFASFHLGLVSRAKDGMKLVKCLSQTVHQVWLAWNLVRLRFQAKKRSVLSSGDSFAIVIWQLIYCYDRVIIVWLEARHNYHRITE